MQAYGAREPRILARLRRESAKLAQGDWQVSPEQGQFLGLIIEIAQARAVIELGTFVGYGTLWMALSLGAHGRIITCDIDDRFPRLGQPYWQEAGVAERIDLRLSPALDMLDGLLAQGRAGAFDLIFIDADKQAYPDYYELALKLLKPGGLVLIDNVFWGGAVADREDRSTSTAAIRRLNAQVHADPRVRMSMIPVGDGLTIARKLA